MFGHDGSECNRQLRIIHTSMNVSMRVTIINGALVQAAVVVVCACVSSCAKFVVAVSSIDSLGECWICGLNVRASEVRRCRDRVPSQSHRLLGWYAAATHLLRGCWIRLSIGLACAQLLRCRVRFFLIRLHHISAKRRMG